MQLAEKLAAAKVAPAALQRNDLESGVQTEPQLLLLQNKSVHARMCLLVLSRETVPRLFFGGAPSSRERTLCSGFPVLEVGDTAG